VQCSQTALTFLHRSLPLPLQHMLLHVSRQLHQQQVPFCLKLADALDLQATPIQQVLL